MTAVEGPTSLQLSRKQNTESIKSAPGSEVVEQRIGRVRLGQRGVKVGPSTQPQGEHEIDQISSRIRGRRAADRQGPARSAGGPCRSSQRQDTASTRYRTEAGGWDRSRATWARASEATH